MSDIDWPLAIALGVVFVVMSLLRWRYFRRRMRRRGTERGEGTPD
jgi:hypothetical protein